MAANSTDDEFVVFYNEHYSLVRAIVCRRLQGSSDIDDVTSLVFRTALEHHRDGATLTLPWLYQVVRNHIGSEYRRAHRVSRFTIAIGSASTGSDAYDRVDSSADLRSALQRLRTRDREILHLAYWDDLTTEEIAGVLRINAGAVRTRLTRAKKALSNELAVRATPANATREVIANG